jgi:TonB family protein
LISEYGRNSLKVQSPKVLEASLILTLMLITALLISSKEFVGQTKGTVLDGVILKVEDIPVTHQIRRLPVPPLPSIPMESDDPLLADDLTLPDLTCDMDDPPPPPPSVDYTPVIHVVVEHPPKLIGGEVTLMKYIIDHNLYPPMALQAGVGGMCTIQFVVDTTGIPTDIFVFKENPKGLGFGEAGMKAIKAMRFTPGKQHDRLVKVQMQQVISYAVK